MHSQKINNVLSLTIQQKYDYFISKIAEMEEVWGLFNDGWASSKDKNNQIFIPFWPEPEFAILCCKDQWLNYSAKAITLNDFLYSWLPGMDKDKRLASIFYSDKMTENIVITPSQLRGDIETELKKFF